MTEIASEPRSSPEVFGQRSVANVIRTFLANASLVVAIVCLIMWVRSSTTIDSARFSVGGIRFVVNSAIDRLIIIHGTDTDGRWSVESNELEGGIQDAWEPGFLKSLGIQTGRGDLRAGLRQAYWIRAKWRTLFLVAVLAPAMHWAELLRARRRDRANPTLPPYCPECGTDLRAATRKCPECGRSFAQGFDLV